jgi:hypothetical protein
MTTIHTFSIAMTVRKCAAARRRLKDIEGGWCGWISARKHTIVPKLLTSSLSLSLSLSATKKCTAFGSCMYEDPKFLIKPSISCSFDCRYNRAKATAIAIASTAIGLRSHCNSPKTLTDRKGRRGEKPGRDARKTTTSIIHTKRMTCLYFSSVSLFLVLLEL